MLAVNPHLQGGFALRLMSALIRYPMVLKDLYPAMFNAIIDEGELMTLETAPALAVATLHTEALAMWVDFLYTHLLSSHTPHLSPTSFITKLQLRGGILRHFSSLLACPTVNVS